MHIAAVESWADTGCYERGTPVAPICGEKTSALSVSVALVARPSIAGTKSGRATVQTQDAPSPVTQCHQDSPKNSYSRITVTFRWNYMGKTQRHDRLGPVVSIF